MVQLQIQWQDFLLRYGASSEKLHKSVARLTLHMANNVMNWPKILALIASQLIALAKNQGFMDSEKCCTES